MLNVFWYELGQFVDVLKHFSHIDLLYLRRRELIAYTSPHSEISFARVFSHKLSSLKVWKVSDNGKSKIFRGKVYATLTAKNWFLSKNESCREKPFVGVIYQPNPTLLSGNKRKTQKNVLSGKFILHCPITDILGSPPYVNVATITHTVTASYCNSLTITALLEQYLM